LDGSKLRSREKTAVETGSRTILREYTKTIPAPLSTIRFYSRQGRRDDTTEEELGHDEPSEILGLEYTQRKAKATLWLVGAETLLQSCRLEFCSSNSCKTRSALWRGEIRQGNAKGLTALRRSI